MKLAEIYDKDSPQLTDEAAMKVLRHILIVLAPFAPGKFKKERRAGAIDNIMYSSEYQRKRITAWVSVKVSMSRKTYEDRSVHVAHVRMEGYSHGEMKDMAVAISKEVDFIDQELIDVVDGTEIHTELQLEL